MTKIFDYCFAFFLFYIGPAISSPVGMFVLGVVVTLVIVFGAARLVPFK